MTSSTTQSGRSRGTASRSLWSIAATVILAAFTHAYDFGPAAFLAGTVVLVTLFLVNARYRRTQSRFAALLYSLLSLWVIAGFGLLGGVWNHAVKLVVVAGSGGTLPSALEPLFMSPDLGGATYEALWIVLGVASVFAGYFGYRFARTVRWTVRPTAVRPSPVGPGADAGD